MVLADRLTFVLRGSAGAEGGVDDGLDGEGGEAELGGTADRSGARSVDLTTELELGHEAPPGLGVVLVGLPVSGLRGLASGRFGPDTL